MTVLHTALPKQLSMLLVDDHRIYLDGLRMALVPLCANLLIRTAESAASAEIFLKNNNFDLILLDMHLPDMTGLELLQRWQREGCLTPVAIISASNSSQDAKAAIAAGALGFIPKKINGEELRCAVTRILLGETLPIPEPCNKTHLTPRQSEILQFLAKGLPNKSIGRQMGLSEGTVKVHLKLIFQELAVHTRTECVNVARERGLL